MINSNQWLQTVSQTLMTNGFSPVAQEKYVPQNFKYCAHRSRFELSKFGIAEYFFSFAEIPNLTAEILNQFSGAAFRFAKANKSVSLPDGLFSATYSFGVAITSQLDPALGEQIRQSETVRHFGAFEMPVIVSLENGELFYCERTPLWGAAYYAGFRRVVVANLSFHG